MEEQPAKPESGESAVTPEVARPKINEFLRRWLQRRRGPAGLDLEDTEAFEEKDEKKPEKKGRWQRLTSRGLFRNLFRSSIATPEAIPEKKELPELRPSQNSDSKNEVNSPSEAIINTAPVELPRPEVAASANDIQAVAERVVAPFRTTGPETVTPPNPQTAERVIESPKAAAAVGALLGLEYIGRHRADRKLRGRTQRVERQQKASTQKLEQLRQNTERQTQEISKTVKQPELERLIQVAERQKLRQAQETISIESKPVETLQKQPSLEKIEVAQKVVEQVERQQKPEAVLKQVEVAAEQNLPVEAVYERRHENKDKQLEEAGIMGGSAGSGNEPILLAQAMQNRFGQSQSVNNLRPANGYQQDPQVIYKTAMKNGFWGAVVILVFIAVLAIVNSH